MTEFTDAQRARSRYWQHQTPLCCPKRHEMGWLGSAFWICGMCQVIYVQVQEGHGHDPRSPAAR